MNHRIIERKAIYDTAKIFTSYGWIFREQPIVDLGIDALVETPINEDGEISVFAVQVKGGDKNFYRSGSSLTLYFSERHYLYWNAYSKIHPLLIVLHDPKSNEVYWQIYESKYIQNTTSRWKIMLPTSNVLNEESKTAIYNLLTNYHKKRHARTRKTQYTTHKKTDDLYIKYLHKKGEVFLNLVHEINTIEIPLGYKLNRKDWNEERSFLNWDNENYFVLHSLKRYLKERFRKSSTSNTPLSLEKLRQEVDKMSKDGISGIAEFTFNYQNKDTDVPQYKEFIHAFEAHSKLRKGEYTVMPLDHIIHFKTKTEVFEISTWESQIKYLKDFINGRSYDEIYTETNMHIWGEIYIDAGIEKHKFIPIMLNEWEYYWDDLYRRIKNEIGSTKHLDKIKEQSLRKLETLFSQYNESGNIIEFAYDFDDMVLYPIAVITMLNIFDAEVCYSEYCEFEFYGSNQWEGIDLDEYEDDNYDGPFFFIRPYEL